jgi:feruloyl esterase
MPLGAEANPAGWLLWITGPVPDLLAKEGVPNLSFSFGTELFKYVIFNDPNWNYASYDFANWERDTHLAGTVLNATATDLSRFRSGGGKMILWHGWSDAALSALGSIDYYEQVERTGPDVRQYFRLYLLPGVMHCNGGPGPDQVDWLKTIVDWVENHNAPTRVVATKRDNRGNVVMTRPLYPYPQRASYTGSGSINDAENFVLRKSD